MAATRSRLLDSLGLLGAAALLAGPGLASVRLVPAMTGFGLFALGGFTTLVVAVIGIVRAARGRGLGPGVVAAVVGGAVFRVAASRGGQVPAINDFTTDLTDPPTFRHATTLGPNAGRDLGYRRAFAEVQRECCTDLQPVRVVLAPPAALEQARRVAEHMPAWTITQTDPATGTIEAIATTRIFGFQDDIVIRVRPEADGTSRVDMRSKSRDGKGDIGANAARIRAFMTALRTSG